MLTAPPVTLARVTGEPDGALEEPRYREVLVAIDGSPEADLALAHAVGVAHALNARLTLVAVAPEPPALIAPAAGVTREQLAADIQAEMSGILAAARDAVPDDVSVTTRLLIGDPADEIVRAAEEGGSDLILMGTRGRGRIGALLGSVSQAVLHRARTTVMVVHAPRD
jgi:nucleotide-binding universal stress UspA family protein